MTIELTPRETILQHKEDLIIIAQELQSEGLSAENLVAYNDLIWWIKSIENIEDYRGLDDYTVLWVLDCGFNKCPLRHIENLDSNKSCAEVDCPRFNKCELTKGIFDKYM
jgi:hypothetical protein